MGDIIHVSDAVWERPDLLIISQETPFKVLTKWPNSMAFQPIPPPSIHDQSAAICKDFLLSNQCLKPGCNKRHPDNEIELRKMRQEWIEKKKLKLSENIDPNDPHDGSQKASKEHKHLLFSGFIFDQFFANDSSDSVKVLDIAGGRGTISAELCLSCPLIEGIIVDPRQDSLRPIKKQLKRMNESVEKRLSHIQEWFDDSFPTRYPELFASKSTILLGFHPDQATEYIVDIALKFELSFAIVPCCIFTRENQHRKEITTFDAFVDYLQAKDPRIQRHYLPLKGRNLCLYLVH